MGGGSSVASVSWRSGAIGKIRVRQILNASHKRRIALQVREQVSEDSIMEDAVAGAEGGFAGAERIPCKSHARLEIVIIVVIEPVTGSRSYGLERDGGHGRGLLVEKIGKVSIFLEGNAVELIAHAQLNG